MFHGLNNSFLYTALRLKTSFFRERDGYAKESIGTCFFVVNQKGKPCLVTNRHMLDAGYSDKERKYLGCELETIEIEGFLSPAGSTTLPRDRTSMQFHTEHNQIRFSSTYAEDVACVHNPQIVNPTDLARADFPIPYDFVATKDWLDSNLSVCDFVVFPGYPDWHDKLENRPIMRTGTIASDPRSDYSHKGEREGRKIAYEAFSFDGSSGSPVFAVMKGLRPGPGISFPDFREPKFIGINAGHLEADFGHHSGISYFFKSSVILELIDADG